MTKEDFQETLASKTGAIIRVQKATVKETDKSVDGIKDAADFTPWLRFPPPWILDPFRASKPRATVAQTP